MCIWWGARPRPPPPSANPTSVVPGAEGGGDRAEAAAEAAPPRRSPSLHPPPSLPSLSAAPLGAPFSPRQAHPPGALAQRRFASEREGLAVRSDGGSAHPRAVEVRGGEGGRAKMERDPPLTRPRVDCRVAGGRGTASYGDLMPGNAPRAGRRWSDPTPNTHTHTHTHTISAPPPPPPRWARAAPFTPSRGLVSGRAA